MQGGAVPVYPHKSSEKSHYYLSHSQVDVSFGLFDEGLGFVGFVVIAVSAGEGFRHPGVLLLLLGGDGGGVLHLEDGVLGEVDEFVESVTTLIHARENVSAF